MRLKSIILENFRIYDERILVNFNDLTAFIGRNEAGKSTILEALDIFLDGGSIKIDQDDANKATQTNEVLIGCIFDDLPHEIIIDESYTTNLNDEYLLNSNGDLEIHKVFDCSKTTIKPQIHIIANHPTAQNFSNLLTLKHANLKILCQDLGVLDSVEDQRKSAHLRKAIWESATREALELQNISIQIDKEDAKQIWDKLSNYLPMYALFKSDRSSVDSDSEVQDPMKIAVKQAINKVQPEIDKIKAMVEQEVTEVAIRTLQKLGEMDSSLAQELTPNFVSDPRWEAFKIDLTGDNGIPINKRGSGIRRLILLNFFRAEVERKFAQSDNRSIIYAIEEPETSQHADYQKMIMETLVELSEQPNYQVILTTHVPALAGLIPITSLRYIFQDSGKNCIEQGDFEKNAEVFSKIAATLGILPQPHEPQVIFCVEGIHDVNFWHEISIILNQHDSSLPNLRDDSRIVLIAVGGANLIHWVRYNYLRKFNKPEIHIYDRDLSAYYQPYCDKVIARNDGSWATLTTKRTIENYIHPDAIKKTMNIHLNFTDNDDVPLLVAEALCNKHTPNKWAGLNDTQKKREADGVKAPLNKKVVRQMTVAQLKQSDLNDEVISWLKKIASYLK